MFRIGICMENERKRKELEEEIIKWKMKNGLRMQVCSYENGENFTNGTTQKETPDVLFIDVCHDSKNTLNALREYRKSHKNIDIVSVGNYKKDDNIFTMCELQSNYIQYPFEKNQIYDLVKEEYKRFVTDDESYVFQIRPNFIKIPLKKVMYFSSTARKIRVVCTDGTFHEFYRKLDSVEEELRNKRIKFIRTHQSQLVNPEYVDGYAGSEITLKNGEKLSVSTTRRRRTRIQLQMLNICR